MTEKLVCSTCQEVTEHEWVKNIVAEGLVVQSTRRGQYKCTGCDTLRMGMAQKRDDEYCHVCKRKTEHKYLGTSRYSEPVSGTKRREVVEEGWYECSECHACCIGPVQG